MSKNFYVLDGIELVESFQSNLCWAACLEVIHKLIKSNTPKDFQIKAVNKYKNSSCFSEPRTQETNLPLPESCLEPIYEGYNLNIDVIQKNSEKNNYQFYVRKLNENGLPLLVALNDIHLVIVCGYGDCDGYDYLMVIDPSKPNNQDFWRVTDQGNFYANHKNTDLWYLKSSTNNANKKELKRIKTEPRKTDIFKFNLPPYYCLLYTSPSPRDA